MLPGKASRPEYKDRSSFVVRMIVLVGRDEYQRPQWGSARELALLEIDRAALEKLSNDQIAELDAASLDKLMLAQKLSLANLAGLAAK